MSEIATFGMHLHPDAVWLTVTDFSARLDTAFGQDPFYLGSESLDLRFIMVKFLRKQPFEEGIFARTTVFERKVLEFRLHMIKA